MRMATTLRLSRWVTFALLALVVLFFAPLMNALETIPAVHMSQTQYYSSHRQIVVNRSNRGPATTTSPLFR